MGRLNLLGGQINLLLPTQLTCYLPPWFDGNVNAVKQIGSFYPSSSHQDDFQMISSIDVHVGVDNHKLSGKKKKSAQQFHIFQVKHVALLPNVSL